MKKIRKITWVLFVLGCLFTPAAFGQRCGKERWSVKTGTDAGASKIDLTNPQAATIGDLIALQPPNPLPADSRFAPTENTVFILDATLTDFKLETGSTGDSDYHLVLQDDRGNTMVAEIPSPACVGANSPFAGQIASTRAKFDAQFTATSSFQTANLPVRVTGVGFFDFFHHQHGAASNVIELHPLLNIEFNPQPAGGDFTISVSPATVHLLGGSSSSVTITAVPAGGGNLPNINFTASGLPASVTSRTAPSTGGKANLILSATSSAPNGTFPVIITGSANGRSHSQTIALNMSGALDGSEPQQWEYKMVSAVSEQDVVDQANQLGAQEWELVSVVRLTGSPAWRAFFKRATKH